MSAVKGALEYVAKGSDDVLKKRANGEARGALVVSVDVT